MKQITLITILMLISLYSFANPRGTTQHDFSIDGVCVGQAPYYIPISNPIPKQEVSFSKDEWIAADSLNLNTILRAGHQYGIQFNSINQSMQLSSSLGEIIPAAQTAVNKSPRWLRAKLFNVFSQLTSEKQLAWSAIINDAIDPYIDEIAFCLANSSVQYLASNYSDPALFEENAMQLYAIDTELPYVQIVNHGTSTTDPDFYSTTSYYKTTADSQVVQVEVPRDVYYWYIVHLKITDEIPAYVDPALVESNTNHSNNILLPPEGKFWRSFLYTAQEEAYPVLRDTLMDCQTLFNRNGVSGDAIRAIQWWINNTMTFTSNSERPHQPVRIYKKHFGRCGEYADYTAAVSRTALIPCTSILSASTDHTWNEFWEDGWVQWEPVNGYIDTPLVYENGWGKVFGSVFEIRSDGYLSPVTSRYSSGICSITIAVKDSTSLPVDGARVILGMYDAGIKFDMIGFTDNNGLVVFPVGENRHYYARVESSVGICPDNPGTYLSLVENSVIGESYSYLMVINNAKPQPIITQIAAPQDTVYDWRFAIQFDTPKQVLYGKATWDDLSANGSQPYFYHETDIPGRINLLMTDADNYMFYNVAHEASAFNVQADVSSGSALFSIPENSIWYAFLDNSSQVTNPQLITGIMLYQHYGVANDDPTIPYSTLALYPAYPNPFKQETIIKFNLPKTTFSKLCVYNAKGQKVKTLMQAEQKAGLNSIIWNGTDDNDKNVSNGVYYFRLTTGNKHISKKVLLLK